MNLETKSKWCIEKHQLTNHFYDKYLPYEMHLRMVVNVFHDFKHLLPKKMFTLWDMDTTLGTIELACWGHDLIEDARVSYNDCIENLCPQYDKSEIADIIFAVSNETGKTRKDRANDKYYEKIRNTPGAIFVKLCDRIANIQYSKMTKSRMFKMYKEENDDFLKRVNADEYPEMKQYLINLFND